MRGLANTVPTDPTRPSRPTIALSIAICGFQRRDWLTMNSSPVTSDAAASESASATVGVTGFSPRTGRPAKSAAVVTA